MSSEASINFCQKIIVSFIFVFHYSICCIYGNAIRINTKTLPLAAINISKKPKGAQKEKQPDYIKKLTRQPAKKWTFMVYLAADNDLNFFAWKNIKQMEQVGSNEHINIIIQLSERGTHKVTQRYIVHKNSHTRIPMENKKLNSGSPHTLINFCSWTIQNFPAENYALILWNHGTGALEPARAKTINPSELFIFNPSNNMLELDRTIGFLDFINSLEMDSLEHRGICFDEFHRSYIDNQKLDFALNEISQKSLGGKKLSILGFDACLMSMIEIACFTKKYAHIMVGSQEVELGSGWNYQTVLAPFNSGSPDKETFARHIVASYQQAYIDKTNDYTQSAIQLEQINLIESNINQVANLLIQSIINQKNNSTKNVIKMCRSKRFCTCFDEPTYIDLHHFYRNLFENLAHFQCNDQQKGIELKNQLQQSLKTGMELIEQTVIANSVGKNLAQAKGISIYFPNYTISQNYTKSIFAQQSRWIAFLQQYLMK